MTHGEYYQREDGFRGPAASRAAAPWTEVVAWARRDWLIGCNVPEFELPLMMANTGRRMQRVTVGTWDMIFRRRYKDYRIFGWRVPGLEVGKYTGRYTSSNFPAGLQAQAVVSCERGWVFLHADTDGDRTPDYQP